MSLMKILNKRRPRIDPHFAPIHKNCCLNLPFEIFPTNSVAQILSHCKKSHTHLIWPVINCD